MDALKNPIKMNAVLGLGLRKQPPIFDRKTGLPRRPQDCEGWTWVRTHPDSTTEFMAVHNGVAMPLVEAKRRREQREDQRRLRLPEAPNPNPNPNPNALTLTLTLGNTGGSRGPRG